MSTVYRIMYRMGFTPWEHEPLVPLVELIAGPDALPPGRMLDVGCGTGGDAIYAALHGWQVTGVDAVPLALDRARRSAQAAGVRRCGSCRPTSPALAPPSSAEATPCCSTAAACTGSRPRSASAPPPR